MIKNQPTILVILGATGDLMRRKVLPALYHLFENNQLPEKFAVVGVSNQPFSDEDFKGLVESAVENHLDEGVSISKDFLKYFSYNQASFENEADYAAIASSLDKIGESFKTCSNKLFYIASPPRFFEIIINNLAASNLTKPCSKEEGFSRVLIEKPFGKSFHEAIFLDHLLSDTLREEQIYRIDHYLAKEMLQNIILFRFANNLLEEAWNKDFIERIDIKVLEEVGLEGRGDFYDKLGAFSDVGQNHVMQMLALATMENPLDIKADAIRNQRAQVLKHLKPLSQEDIEKETQRGQFEGYKEIEGVKEDSTTETYFKVKAFLDLPKWEGVPVYIEAGKKLEKAQKEIAISFRHPIPCLCNVLSRHYRNSIHFQMEPDPGITIKFWSKKPGQTWEVEEKQLEFRYPFQKLKHPFLEEYSRLLLDATRGDQTLFISSEEAHAAWKFIDPIVSAWKSGAVPLKIYPVLSEKKNVKEIGLVGLGKMGANIARRFMEKGRMVAGYNATDEVTKKLENEGIIGAYSLGELTKKLTSPRIIWLMVPAGQAVDEVIFGSSAKDGHVKHLNKGDIIIDGGNSFYKDSIRRARELGKAGIEFVDVGVSGGPQGAREGACLMVGGNFETYEYLLPLFKDLAVEGGVQFFEGAGAGHFVKMVHNGIEYGMMQAVAEGFNILKESDYKIDLAKAADLYNHGSVIESRLMGWLNEAFEQYGKDLKEVSGSVGRTGEADWTVQAARKMNLEPKNIEQALNFRIKSENNPSYTGQVLTALRNQFGRHGVSYEHRRLRKAG